MPPKSRTKSPSTQPPAQSQGLLLPIELKKDQTIQIRMDARTLKLLDRLVLRYPSSRGRGEILRRLIERHAAELGVTAE